MIDRLSEVKQVRNCTGFGLYDQAFVPVLRRLPDPYPYFRGIVAELGFRTRRFRTTQPRRVRGLTKNNLYTLYDLGVQGIVNHSKIPLRLATILGFASSVVSLIAAGIYFVDEDAVLVPDRPMGVAPLVIGLFCVASVQLFFLGVLGEYVGSIYTQVRNRPAGGRVGADQLRCRGAPVSASPPTVDSALAAIEAAVGDARSGLPPSVFATVSRLTPLINVDLLIQDDGHRTLLTWRDDQDYGEGWHVPGGIIRFKERAADRIAACARQELSAAVSFDPVPIAILESVSARLTRGHFISLLYRCRLTTAPDPGRAAGETPAAGAWRWHHGCPPDLIDAQRRYTDFM